jgi:hypothetical protein
MCLHKLEFKLIKTSRCKNNEDSSNKGEIFRKTLMDMK